MAKQDATMKKHPKTTCLGCAIQKGKIKPPCGSILSSKYFEAHQDYETPIPGFIILDSKMHLNSVDEFTEDEQLDFIKFLCRLRVGMREVLKISVVYLVQKEDSSHHFHVWIFPRYPWMNKKFGNTIQSVAPIMEYAKENMKTDSDIKKVETAAQKLKQFFSESNDKSLN